MQFVEFSVLFVLSFLRFSLCCTPLSLSGHVIAVLLVLADLDENNSDYKQQCRRQFFKIIESKGCSPLQKKASICHFIVTVGRILARKLRS